MANGKEKLLGWKKDCFSSRAWKTVLTPYTQGENLNE